MSSCTECHGMAGEKYDDHTSANCPRLKNKTPNNPVNDELDKILKEFTAPKNVHDGVTGVFYDFSFSMAKEALLAWRTQGVGEARKTGMMATWSPTYNWLYNNHKDLLPEWEALMEEDNENLSM